MRILNSRSSQRKQFKGMFPTTFLIGNRHSYVPMELRLALGFTRQISLLGLMAGSKDRCVTVISHHMKKVKSNGFQEMAHLDAAVHHTCFLLLKSVGLLLC